MPEDNRGKSKTIKKRDGNKIEPGRQQIIRASIDLFAENGIKNASILKIAQKLGASRGMIYHHFKDGKVDIVSAILQLFEDYVRRSIPNPTEWKSPDVNVEQILSKLFFRFSDEDAAQYRKIVRIILSEMFFDEQIEQYLLEYFIIGREKLLEDCFESLVGNSLIFPLDVASIARFLNRLIIVYEIIDALDYKRADTAITPQYKQLSRDCINLIKYILRKTS